MVQTDLNVRFEGPGIADGVPLDDWHNTLQHVQTALRLMVGHLSGNLNQRGRPSNVARQQSMLRLRATKPGSLVAELALVPPSDSQATLENFGPVALETILNWQQGDDPSVPRNVANELTAIGSDLSPETSVVGIGSPHQGRYLEFHRQPRQQPEETTSDEALLHGWLKEVNWDRHTAQLHRGVGRYVALQFSPTLDEDMVQLATQYVSVSGRGTFNADGSWRSVSVERVTAVRASDEPFDLDEFRSVLDHKVFRSADMVTASEPFDVEEFNRVIREGRDA